MACQRTQDKLDGLIKEYNAAKLQLQVDKGKTEGEAVALLKSQFNQNFNAGTEGDPQCKCGVLVRHHLNHAAGGGAAVASSASPRHVPRAELKTLLQVSWMFQQRNFQARCQRVRKSATPSKNCKMFTTR